MGGRSGWVLAASLLAAASGWLAQTGTARACGGFFCGAGPGAMPVDQTAERIVFAVDEEAGTTDMIVQISFQGLANDFAWVLPVADVPVEGSLETFRQEALALLDPATGPAFFPDCAVSLEAASGGDPDADDFPVEVHLREDVGPYDVAVIEAEDPSALVGWLRANGYRVTTPMEPFIAEYTARGMKLLALKLNNESKVGDIAPFKMTLPGTSPSIPLRMTAIAAEPEMSLLVYILGTTRYAPANWPELEVDLSRLVFDVADDLSSIRTNYPALVAHAVDDAGGQGWAVDSALTVDAVDASIRGSNALDGEDGLPVRDILDFIAPYETLTRLYTRVSAEEMTSDPVFRRSDAELVPRLRRFEADCSAIQEWRPCDFFACGAGGECFEVSEGESTVGGCACLPGFTARTTLGPSGEATVACQDVTMSFIAPGDRETPDATPLPDPCVGFDCEAGTCVPINGTPTCTCDRGFVAVGAIDPETRARATRCVAPAEAIHDGFYERPAPVPARPTPSADDGCAAAGGGAGGLGLALALSLLARRRRRGSGE